MEYLLLVLIYLSGVGSHWLYEHRPWERESEREPEDRDAGLRRYQEYKDDG